MNLSLATFQHGSRNCDANIQNVQFGETSKHQQLSAIVGKQQLFIRKLETSSNYNRPLDSSQVPRVEIYIQMEHRNNFLSGAVKIIAGFLESVARLKE